MKHRTVKLVIALATALVCVIATAAPASATVHHYDVKMESGRLTVGSMSFDTPGSGVGSCTGTTHVWGTIDDSVTTDNITATLSINSPFVLPPIPPFFAGGNYILQASGSATGTNAGNYSALTDTFSGLVLPTITFTVKTYNASTCTAGATTVCSGTVGLTVSGKTYAGATLPLFHSDAFSANGAGSVTSRGSCNLPFSLFVITNTTVGLGDNPNDDYGRDIDFDGDNDPDGVTDDGAIFVQI